MEAHIRQEGETAAYEAGVHGLHPEVVKMMGKMRFRTSYGQNQLQHSIEVAHLASMMAAELGADVAQTRRAAFLHDIGKVMTSEIEGPHHIIGADFIRRFGEVDEVCEAVSGHHDHDPEDQSVEAVLVQAADAISGARPGARRESVEHYVKRLEALESVANSFEGVEKSFAIQAGREVRIMVRPDEIDDHGAVRLARDIVKRIEETLQYPGQVKVTVVRETRAVDLRPINNEPLTPQPPLPCAGEGEQLLRFSPLLAGEGPGVSVSYGEVSMPDTTGKIDLHLHTNKSDGRLSPTELVRLAHKGGVRRMALTDHDTTDGVEEAMAEGAALGVEVIPGVELGTDSRSGDLHMLGLFLDYQNADIPGDDGALPRGAGRQGPHDRLEPGRGRRQHQRGPRLRDRRRGVGGPAARGPGAAWRPATSRACRRRSRSGWRTAARATSRVTSSRRRTPSG